MTISETARIAAVNELLKHRPEILDYPKWILRRVGGKNGSNPFFGYLCQNAVESYPRIAVWMNLASMLVYRAMELTLGEEKMPRVEPKRGADFEVEFHVDPVKYCLTASWRCIDPQLSLILRIIYSVAQGYEEEPQALILGSVFFTYELIVSHCGNPVSLVKETAYAC